DLVLNNFDLGAVAHNFAVGRLDLIAAADVDAHAGEELERATTGGRLGIAEHHADLFANLVGENTHALGLVDHGGEAAHGLRHEARLSADGGVAHLAIEFGL